ncbi:MAG: T9SS type A sorting domain-containing protein [Bacteroidota bacterium]
MKKYLLHYILPLFIIGFLTVSNRCWAQTYTLNSLSAGLTAGNLSGYQTGIAVYGFSLNVTGLATVINGFNIKNGQTGSALNTYFANAKFYSGTTNDYSTAVLTQIGTATINSGEIAITGLTEVYSINTTKYYYLVVDDIYDNTGIFQGAIIYNQSPSAIVATTGSTSAFNSSGSYGIYHALQASTAPVVTNLTGGLVAAATLTLGQTAQPLFGFSLNVTGGRTFSQFSINSGNGSLSSYFSNFKLYRNTTSTYGTGTPTQVGTAAISGSYVNITGLTEAFTNNAGQTNNYFLVGDYSNAAGAVPSSIQFNFANAQSPAAFTQSSPIATTYNTFNVTGNAYDMNTAAIAMSSQQNGLTAASVYPGQTGVAVFGFGLSTTSGTSSITQINLGSDNGSLSTYYGNFKLYSSSTNSYAGTLTFLGNGTVTGGSFVNFTGFTAQTINGTAKYYFVVADVVYASTGTNSTTFKFVSGQTSNALVQSSPASTYNNFTVTGNTYSITQPTITFGNSVTGLITGPIYYGNTTQAIYGFSVQAAGITTLNGFVLGDLGGIAVNTTFANCKLYRATSSVFNSANIGTYTYLGTGSLSGTNITFSGLTDVVNNTTQYYFMVVDDIYYSSSNHTQLVMNSITTTSGTSNPGIYGTYYNFSLPNATITGANDPVANGITPGALYYGATNVVLYGFSIQVNGSLNITNFNIASTGYPSAVPNQYFSNARLYRSTGSTFPGGTPAYTSANVSVGATYFTANVSETITNGTYYYWLVVDYTVSTGPAASFAAAVTGGQSSLFIVTNPSSTNYNSSYITGKSFTIPITEDWKGTTNNFALASNYKLLDGVTTGIVPDATTTVRIGAVSYTNAPAITTDTPIGGLTLGSTASPTIAITSGKTLTINNGLNLLSGAAVTFSGGTVQIPTGTASSIAPTAVLTLGANTTLNNLGIFTLLSSSAGTGSVAAIPSTSSLTGTYVVQRYFTGGTLANRGYRLMSSPVNNSGTLPVTSSATYNFNSLKTNLLITGTGGSASGWDQPNGYTANGPTILFYNTASNNFTVPTTLASTSGTAGKGFYFYFRGDNQTNLTNKVVKTTTYAIPEANIVGLESGTLNQQGFSYSLSNASIGYNLVGNPYPSSISITQASLTNTNNTVYTYTSGGTSVTAHSVTSTPWQVASGQGFFLKAINTGASIAFSESLKSTGQPTLLLGTPAVIAEGNILLQMVQDSSNYDFAELRFMDSYDKNYVEAEDADDFNGSGQVIFFGAMTADNHLVAIASQPLDKQKTSVFLSVNDNTSGTFKINKINLANIADKYDVWLMDHFKNDSLDLRANTTYTFTIDKANAATFGNSRMEVVIRKKVVPPYQLLTFTGQRSNTDNVLNWTTQNEYTFTYFELQRSFDGTTYEGVNNSTSTSAGKYTFTDQTTKPLVYYRLKQTDINDVVTYSTIVILKSDNSSVFSVYPNPTDNNLQFSLTQIVKGTVTLRIYNSLGTLMKLSTYTIPSGQQDVSKLTPGSYMVELVDDTTKKLIASAKFIKL